MNKGTNNNAQTLKKGALGLGDIVMQAITHTAPATAILFTIPFISARAGVAAPFSYLIAFFLILMLGSTLTQLAKHLPSAGGYYTYISHTVSPRAGFLTSWLYILYDPAITGYSLAFTGAVTQQTLMLNYGINFPWWLFLIITGSFVAFASYRGIEISSKLLIALGLTEIACVLLLSVWGLAKPGNGGINVHSFNPTNARGFGGLAMGVIFSVFALAGWEGVAPLAEESRNPKKIFPKAIMYSIIIIGFFLVFCSWCILIGWGTNDVASFIGAKENPTFILAKRFWGNGYIILLFAFINSMVAVAISANNSAVRIWFAMARSGSMPKWLGKIHPSYQTPRNAVWLQYFLTFFVGVGLGLLIGPENEFDFMGLVITFTLALIYSMGNIGVILFYHKEKRSEYNFILHTLFPVLGIIVLVFVIWSGLDPWPEAPYGYAFWAVVVWFILGLMTLLIMKIMKKDNWRSNAGKSML